MANTKTATVKAADAKVKIETQTEVDVATLRSQIAEQQKQIEALMTMLSGNVNTTQDTKSTEDIDAYEEILVISLTPNKLNLLGDGGTVLYAFDNMYEEQYIDYITLKDIVRLNRKMAQNGRFYIADERAVSKFRLKNDYQKILSPEQLKNILNNNVSTVLELYKLAPVGQKDTIIELVKQKKFNGDNIDYNLLKELGDLCGVDLANIEDATKIQIEQ